MYCKHLLTHLPTDGFDARRIVAHSRSNIDPTTGFNFFGSNISQRLPAANNPSEYQRCFCPSFDLEEEWSFYTLYAGLRDISHSTVGFVSGLLVVDLPLEGICSYGSFDYCGWSVARTTPGL
jgi:hypothetical protein